MRKYQKSLLVFFDVFDRISCYNLSINMSEFQKQKNDKNIWHSPIILFVMIVIILIFAYNMIDILEKVRETSKKKSFVNQQVNQLKEREEILNKNIEKLNTEQGIEEEIREKYQLVKKGEKMVVIIDSENNIENKYIKDTEKKTFSNFIKNLFN